MLSRAPVVRAYCRLTVCLVVFLAGSSYSRSASADSGERATPIDFAHEIAPIFREHCLECHGGQEAEGGFSLNTRALVLEAEVVAPEDPDNSPLLQRLLSDDPEKQMPPPDRPRLDRASIATLRAWIEGGVVWQEGMTFATTTYEPPLRPRRPALPPAIDGRTHPVDRIVDAYLAARELPRPPIIDDAVFMRRVSLDLVGLPPRPAQLAAFLADEASDKRARLVEQLLNDKEAYATHWLSFWNDLLRNAYSGTGFIDDGRKQITGWLYRALLENKPYDQFVRELIAPTAESEGFVRGIRWRGNVNASQKQEVQFAQSVSQVLLGINMKCASCHDSFVDRWSLGQTYGLAAIYAEAPLEIHRCDKPSGRMANAAWIFPELGQVDAEAPRPARLKQLAALMTHPQNGRLTRTIVNRMWHRLLGRGIVHPVDSMDTAPWSEDLLDFLAVALTDASYDVKQVLRLIVSSQAYQSQTSILEAESKRDAFVYTGPHAKRMTAEQFLDAIWSIAQTWPQPDGRAFAGDGRQQGGQLRAVLEVLDPLEAGQPDEKEAWQARWGERLLRASLTPLDGLQATLGRPRREQVVSRRPGQLSTFEALVLANGGQFSEILSNTAQQLLKEHGDSSAVLADKIFQATLGRSPTAGEQELVATLAAPTLGQEDVEDLLWGLLMLPEFQWVR